MGEPYEMYLDESGEFEKAGLEEQTDGDKLPIRLIGGIVVPPSLKQKEKELREALMDVGNEFFPGLVRVTQIHMSDDKLGFKRREALRKRLGEVYLEIIREAPIAFIYDLKELTEDVVSPGAHLYRNMLVHLLQTVIYYHPFFEQDALFSCNLAHRRFPYIARYEEALAGQGFLKLKDAKSGLTEFTAITEADLKSIMEAIRDSLRFRTQRLASYRVKPYAQWDNPFMVMADWTCNTVLHILLESRKDREIHSALLDTFGRDNILFYCQSEYEFPESLLTTFHEGRAAHFLAGYLEREQNQPYSDNYLLTPGLRRAFGSVMKIGSYEECNTLISLADKFLNDKLFYRLGDVEGLITLVKDRLDQVSRGGRDPLWDPLAFRYHDAAMRYANHTGNVLMGNYHRDSGERIHARIPRGTIEEQRKHHEFINRASITDDNEFAFERAIERLEPIREKEATITDLLGGGKNEIFGKICGSLAQNYAFLKKRAEAEGYFELAKAHLPEDDDMQASFRAHLALDNKDEESYQRDVCFLLKQPAFPGYEQCVNACFEDIRKRSFPFHLVLKGMIVFPPDAREKERIVNSLGIDPENPPYRNHPWELIFIVFGRICRSIQKPGLASAFWHAAAEFPKSPEQLTLVMIGHSARTWEALHWLDSGDIDKARSLLDPIAKTFQELGDKDHALGIFNPKKLPDELDGETRAGWFDNIGQRFLTELDEADETILKALSEDFINRFTYNYW